MIIPQLVAWAIVTYGIARGLNWLQARIPEDCDVFRAIAIEALIISIESEGPEAIREALEDINA